MFRSRAILAVTISLAAIGVAAAQPAVDGDVSAARELLAMTYPDKAMALIQDSLVDVIAAGSSPNLAAALKREPSEDELERFRTAVKRAYNSVMTRADWEKYLLVVLVGNFTEAEMRALIDFHRTPLGRKLLEFQQSAPERGMKAAQELFLSKEKEMSEAMQRELSAAFPELVKPG